MPQDGQRISLTSAVAQLEQKRASSRLGDEQLGHGLGMFLAPAVKLDQKQHTLMVTEPSASPPLPSLTVTEIIFSEATHAIPSGQHTLGM